MKAGTGTRRPSRLVGRTDGYPRAERVDGRYALESAPGRSMSFARLPRADVRRRRRAAAALADEVGVNTPLSRSHPGARCTSSTCRGARVPRFRELLHEELARTQRGARPDPLPWARDAAAAPSGDGRSRCWSGPSPSTTCAASACSSSRQGASRSRRRSCCPVYRADRAARPAALPAPDALAPYTLGT